MKARDWGCTKKQSRSQGKGGDAVIKDARVKKKNAKDCTHRKRGVWNGGRKKRGSILVSLPRGGGGTGGGEKEELGVCFESDSRGLSKGYWGEK